MSTILGPVVYLNDLDPDRFKPDPSKYYKQDDLITMFYDDRCLIVNWNDSEIEYGEVVFYEDHLLRILGIRRSDGTIEVYERGHYISTVKDDQKFVEKYFLEML